jgi:hypothetical protein
MRLRSITAKILFLLLMTIAVNAQGQYQYSIDLKEKENRHIPISYRISQVKENIKQASAYRQKHRFERKTSNQIRRHTYNIQTRKVKKRMRKSLKKSEEFNGENSLLCVLIDKIF